MTIRVLLFASLRDRAGTGSVDLALPEESTVKSAVAALAEKFPAMKDRLNRVMFAVNQQYSDATTILKQGDELALIPPVSGG